MWLTAAGAAKWADDRGLPAVRQNGALRLVVRVMDPLAAVADAADAADRLHARGTVLGGGLVPHTKAWVDGVPAAVPLRRGRGVHVGALERVGHRLDPTDVPVVDAAMESLLMGPGEQENVSAADRRAALVACSLPRAELTRLARAHASTTNDALAQQLNALRATGSAAPRCSSRSRPARR